MKKQLFIICSCFFLLAGCTAKEKISTYNAQEEKTKVIQQEIEQMKSVQKAKILVLNHDLIVALDMKPFYAFKERKIASDLQKKLEEKWPNEEIIVSSDFKIAWEIGKVMEEKDEEKVQEKIAYLKKIVKEKT